MKANTIWGPDKKKNLYEGSYIFYNIIPMKGPIFHFGGNELKDPNCKVAGLMDLL